MSEDEYVEDAATRDEVTAYLNAKGIKYTVDAVAPATANQTVATATQPTVVTKRGRRVRREVETLTEGRSGGE